MNFARVRAVDRWVGVPLCFLFTIVRKTLGRFFERRAQLGTPRRLLFIKLIEQGSTVLLYDTLKRAVDRLGAENVFFWVFEENKMVLDLLELIPEKNIFVVRTKPFFTRFPIDIFKTLAQIWRAKIDTVVDMEFYARAPALLSYLTGARRRIGLHRFTAEAPYRGDLMTHRVEYNPYVHTALFFRILLESAFEDPRDEPLLKKKISREEPLRKAFRPTPKELENLKATLNQISPEILKGPIYLLNANCSDMIPIRKWDSEKYLDLGRRLLANNEPAHILFTGAPSERTQVDALVETFGHPRAFSVAGKTTFRELITLYTLSDLLVTNDSGPGHFSSMTEIPCLVLFGPETPLLYGPLGPGKKALTIDLACQPCVNVLNHRFTPCTNNRCMQELSVDFVYKEARTLLASREGSRKSSDGPLSASA